MPVTPGAAVPDTDDGWVVELAGGWPNALVAAGAVLPGVAELVAAVDVPMPKRGFAAGADEVEVDVGGAVVVAPPPRLANKLEVAGGAEVAVPNKDGAAFAAGAPLVVGTWVAGVLAAGGKLKAGFGASEAGAVVAAVFAPELGVVEEGLLKRPPPGVELAVPAFRLENMEGFGCVESAGFAAPKRGCWPAEADPNIGFVWPFSAGGGPAGVVELN